MTQILCVIMISFLLIKQTSGIQFTKTEISSGNIKYTTKRCFLLGLLGFANGWGGTVFGLSGGSIMNPLLIFIGFDPLVII